MLAKLKNSPLFANMSEDDIEKCIKCSGSQIAVYQKDEVIFHQQDEPKKLFILVEGAAAVCRDTMTGKRNIIAAFRQPGELFGEVFLFLKKNTYDNYAVAVNQAKVLQMPKQYLYSGCTRNCGYHTMLISNMLSILAQKAYYLNQKLQIISSPTLRDKISKLLQQNADKNGVVSLKMNREELADFLNAARPSLSRELMKMQSDGLIKVDGKKIKIIDMQKLQRNL